MWMKGVDGECLLEGRKAVAGGYGRKGEMGVE